VGTSRGLVKQKNIKLVFVASRDHSVEGDLVNANSAQTVLYFFLLMLYKTSTCKIFLLCAVVVFFTTFIH
jgi:hypothetical protein